MCVCVCVCVCVYIYIYIYMIFKRALNFSMGLVSYLLVIYYQNARYYGAGILTVFSDQVGNVAFLMVIAWMISFGSL